MLVAVAGIEPALPKEQDFESSVSTSSTTLPFYVESLSLSRSKSCF